MNTLAGSEKNLSIIHLRASNANLVVVTSSRRACRSWRGVRMAKIALVILPARCRRAQRGKGLLAARGADELAARRNPPPRRAHRRLLPVLQDGPAI